MIFKLISFANIFKIEVYTSIKFFDKKIAKNNAIIEIFLFLLRKKKKNNLFIF